MIRVASTSPSEPAPPASLAELRRSTTSALARQSVVTLYAHVALGAIALSTPAGGAPRNAATALGFALIALVLPRLLAAHSLPRLREREPERWERIYAHCALVSSGGICMGAGLFIAVGDLGQRPWTLLLALAGVGASGLTMLAGDVTLLRFAALCRGFHASPDVVRSAVLGAAPVASAPETVAVAELVPSAPGDGVPASGGGNVLLAEDMPANQLLIASYLRKMGATATFATNGRIAVEAARAALREGRPFDIILMDMQMPELDGYEATRTLRSEGYGGPIVAVTANAMAGDRERCLAAGCNEYLSKPIDRRSFTSTVERFVALSRARLAVEDTVVGPLPAAPSIAPPLVSELASDPDMQEILPAFLQALGGRAAALQAAIVSGDAPALKRLAHQLKGVAGGYGFPSITEQAKVVEDALASDDEPGLAGAVDALTRLCLRARDAGHLSTSRA